MCTVSDSCCPPLERLRRLNCRREVRSGSGQGENSIEETVGDEANRLDRSGRCREKRESGKAVLDFAPIDAQRAKSTFRPSRKVFFSLRPFIGQCFTYSACVKISAQCNMRLLIEL